MCKPLHQTIEKNMGKTMKQVKETMVAKSAYEPLRQDEASSYLSHREKATGLQLAQASRYEGLMAQNLTKPAPQNAARCQDAVQDEYENLSWIQKKKLLKRQKSTQEAEHKLGHTRHTLLTSEMDDQRINGADAARRTVDHRAATDSIVQAPTVDLFVRKYQKGNDCPYRMAEIEKRAMELDRAQFGFLAYQENVRAGKVAPDVHYEANYKVKMELKKALNEARGWLYFVEGIEPYPPQSDVARTRSNEEIAASKIQAYENLAAQYDQLVEYEKDQQFQLHLNRQEVQLQTSKDNTPEQQLDIESLGFAFHTRPQGLEEMRAILDDGQYRANVDQHASLVQQAWAEYIRTLRTVDQQNTALSFVAQQGPHFEKQALRATAQRNLALDRQATLENCLKHLIRGDELTQEADLYLTTKFDYATPASIQRARPENAAPLPPMALAFQEKILQRSNRQAALKAAYRAMDPTTLDPKMDQRMLSGPFSGWNTDAEGNPATPEDAAQAEIQTQRMRIVMSQSSKARDAYFDEEVHSLLTRTYDDPAFFTPEYYLNHYDEVTDLIMRSTLYANLVTADPDYFGALAPEIQAEIKVRSRRESAMTDYFKALIGSMGLRANGKVADNAYAQAQHAQAVKSKEILDARTASLEQDIKLEILDIEHEDITKEECPNLISALNLIGTPRFFDKHTKRSRQKLDTSSMSTMFACIRGNSLQFQLDNYPVMSIENAQNYSQNEIDLIYLRKEASYQVERIEALESALFRLLQIAPGMVTSPFAKELQVGLDTALQMQANTLTKINARTQ